MLDYYPFGMTMQGEWSQNNTVSPSQNYLYNGKELDQDFGLDWYHYGARMYDPQIGRFTGVDPISDQFPHLSTYNYASNRPISGIDLHGLQYLDHNLKFAMENNKITVNGKLDINVKLLNMSSDAVNSKAKSFHQRKSSSTFDNKNTLSFKTTIPINPLTGDALGKEMSVVGNVDVDFNFETIKDKSQIKTGDVVLGLVNKLEDAAGIADRAGHAYLIEIASFNKVGNNVDTHEKGHLLGDLVDMRGKDAPYGFLMSYNGNGFKLKQSERRSIIENLIYQAGLSARGKGHEQNNTRRDLEDLIDDHVEN